MLLVELLGTFGKGPGTKPLPVPLGDERRLERDVRNRQRVVEPLGELERELDVLARGLEVALTPGAARTPLENAGPSRSQGIPERSASWSASLRSVCAVLIDVSL